MKSKAKPALPRAPIATGQRKRRTGIASHQFKGKERLTTLTGDLSGNPIIQSFDWNPGLSQTFTRGHRAAAIYDSYSFNPNHVNAVSYKPSAPSTTSGIVYILFDYDPTDSPPTTEAEFSDSHNAYSTAVWQPLTANINLNLAKRMKYIMREGCLPTSKLDTDLCTVHIAAFGYGNTNIDLGTMFIHYEASLHSPSPIQTSPRLPRCWLTGTFSNNQALPTGTTILEVSGLAVNTLNGSLTVGGGISLPRATYALTYHIGLDHALRDAVATFTAVRARLDGVELPLASHALLTTHPTFSTDMFSTANQIVTVTGSSVLTIDVETDHPEDLTLVAARSSITLAVVG